MDMEFNHDRISTNYTVHPPPPLPSHNPNPTAYPPSSVHVHIKFLHQTTHRFYNRPHHNDENDNHNHNRRPDLIATVHDPITSASICFPAADLMQPYPATTSYQSVIHVLEILGLIPTLQERIAADVLLAGRTFLEVDLASNTGRSEIPVHVEVRTVQVHAREEREWMERILMESALEGERRGDGGMVAAKAEAVRELKRKRVVEVRGESCRVCLEEYVKGEEVTCMPCGHVFHEGCIETWLGTSHCCPICRFKMPTAD